jgi:GTP cyclohydrolase I
VSEAATATPPASDPLPDAEHGPDLERFEPHQYIDGFLRSLDIDMTDPHLVGTPKRVAAMWDELLTPEEFSFTTFPAETTGMIVLSSIAFVTICAHHMVPVVGHATIAYLPKYEMAGLSKLARTVTYFSRALQVQERMGEQIADMLDEKLQPSGVAVLLEAEHLCMTIRGAQAAGTTTGTTALRGAFLENAATRAEFFAVAGKGQRP